MKQPPSSAVEILPHALTEYVIGSIKNATCRVAKNGRNIVVPKVKQPNKTGRDPVLFKKGSDKWWTLSDDQKMFWHDIAYEHDFWSKWQAFMSSFLLSVGIHGLDYTMANELIYYSSEARYKRYQCYGNSIARNRRYQVDPSYYPRTEETMTIYPVVHDSPLMYIRLLDLRDVNNALKSKVIYRTDPIVEYQYFPLEVGEVEKGYYVRIKRARVGDEEYELFLL